MAMMLTVNTPIQLLLPWAPSPGQVVGSIPRRSGQRVLVSQQPMQEPQPYEFLTPSILEKSEAKTEAFQEKTAGLEALTDQLAALKAEARVADAVLRLPGESVGADIEVECARAHEIPVCGSIGELVERLANAAAF